MQMSYGRGKPERKGVGRRESKREREKLRHSWSCSNKPARNSNAIDMFMSFAHKYLHDSLR